MLPCSKIELQTHLMPARGAFPDKSIAEVALPPEESGGCLWDALWDISCLPGDRVDAALLTHLLLGWACCCRCRHLLTRPHLLGLQHIDLLLRSSWLTCLSG